MDSYGMRYTLVTKAFSIFICLQLGGTQNERDGLDLRDKKRLVDRKHYDFPCSPSPLHLTPLDNKLFMKIPSGEINSPQRLHQHLETEFIHVLAVQRA